VGFIGKNGAGKSTLLKILSRITEPTEGYGDIWGRVGSLLEVGTGFHPELTGRENIFLNGAILGMSRVEILSKFDEIVAFADIEQFLDTPVKHYSSGMYMRLAFAVAAHMEPDILLVDEVLAVGDMSFQKKCLGRMKTVSRQGRTVIFVSHWLPSIRDLCHRAVWIDRGEVLMEGDAKAVASAYERREGEASQRYDSTAERHPDVASRLTFYCQRAVLTNRDGEFTTEFNYGDSLSIDLEVAGTPPGESFSAEFYLHNELGHLVSVGASGPHHDVYFTKNVRRIRIEAGPLHMTSGRYTITFRLAHLSRWCDVWEEALSFVIRECRPFATSWDMPTAREGACVLRHEFSEVRGA
jgi:lipopolysaccharide transport system ATP-binding protein